MKTRYLAIAALAALFVSIGACQKRSDGMSEADIKLASAKPLDSKISKPSEKKRVVRPDEPDAVSEHVAQSLIAQLKGWEKNGNELIDGLYLCSAIHAFDMLKKKSSCVDEYVGDVDNECLVKRGYGRNSIGQILAADRIDLNGDGIPDYIISDRYYCPSLSANQASVYFVMLSHDKRNFRLAYADWASYRLDVVENPSNEMKVLVEKAEKTYGIYSRIMHLVDGKYVPRVCIFEDEHGYKECGK